MCEILVIANGDSLTNSLSQGLPGNTHCQVFATTDAAVRVGDKNLPKPHLLIVDLESMSQPVDQLLEGLNRINPDANVIVIQPTRPSYRIEEFLPYGVDEVISRPIDEKQMCQTIDRLLCRINAFDRLRPLEEKLRKEMGRSQIVAKSRSMQEIMQRLPQLAASTSTVLISGETGTGKELIARAIHYLGSRSGQPFITVDCGALPEHLVENELFGHARGAYTDAGAPFKGLVQEADGGTLFLDEVEALPLAVQSKLLRFLQERQYKPLGQVKYIAVDVRVVAATNLDLAKAVEKKTFREDLYYRLNVIRLHIPPLSKRKADITALVHHFMQRYADGAEPPPVIQEETKRDWLAYHWPGNVRELENRVQEWLSMAHDDLGHDDSSFSDAAPKTIRTLSAVRNETLEHCDRAYLQNLLTHTKGNLSAAARLSGMHRKSLGELLKKYGIQAHNYRE